jgi:hypothetical protein
MSCPVCADTGSILKTLYADKDCVHCEVAIERVELEQWLSAEHIKVDPAEAWLIYRRGAEKVTA